MIINHRRYQDVSNSRTWTSDYATVAFFASYVHYFRFCLSRSHRPPTCQFLSDATLNCIINQRHINLSNFSPRNYYYPAIRSPRHSRKSKHNFSCSKKRSPKRNGRIILSTNYPGSRSPKTLNPRIPSPWKSGDSTPSTQTITTLTRAADLSAQPVPVRPGPKHKGQTDDNHRSITLFTR